MLNTKSSQMVLIVHVIYIHTQNNKIYCELYDTNL